MAKSKRHLRRLLARPPLGSTGVFQEILPHSRKASWAEKLFGHASWLFIACVVLLVILSRSADLAVDTKHVIVVLGAYVTYVLALEISSRFFGYLYDRPSFRMTRVLANIIMVSALIWYSSAQASPLWFFYSLPIFQAIIYFRRSAFLLVVALTVIAYWTLLVTQASLSSGRVNLVQFAFSSLSLAVLSFAFYWLFGSARARRQLTISDIEALRLSYLSVADLQDEQGVFRMLVRRGCELMKVDRGGIFLLSESGESLDLITEGGLTDLSDRNASHLESNAMRVIRTGIPLIENGPASIDGTQRIESVAAFLAVPLLFQRKTIAALFVLDDASERRFAESDAFLLELFASHAAICIENERSGDKVRRSLNHLEVLFELNENISTAISLDEVLQICLREALRAVNADEGSVMLLDQRAGTLEIKAWIVAGEMRSTIPSRKLALGEGIAGNVALTGRAHNCKDTEKDPRFVAPFTDRNVRSILSVPVVSNGGVLCVVNVDSEKPAFFTDDDAKFLSALAAYVAVSLGPFRLRDIGQALTSLSLTDLLESIVESACALTDTEASTIILLDEMTGELRRAAQFPPGRQGSNGPRQKGGLTRHIIASGEPLVITEVHQDPRVKQSVKDQMIKSLIGVPMKVQVKSEGKTQPRIIGVLWVNTTKHRQFLRGDVLLVQVLAGQAASALENARLFEQTQRRAVALEDLYSAALEVSTRKQIPDIANALIERAVSLLKAHGGAVYLLDHSRETLRVVGSFNLDPVFQNESLPFGQGLVSEAIKSKAAMSVVDYEHWPNRIPQLERLGFSVVGAAPILWNKDVYGAVAVHDYAPGRNFNSEELALLSQLGRLAAVALKNARRTEELDSILESSFDAIIATDENARITKLNKRAEQLLHCTAEDLIGQSIEVIFAGETKIDEKGTIYDRSSEGRNLVTSTVTYQGRRIAVQRSDAPLLDHDGNRTGSVTYIRDVAEVVSANRQIRLLECLLTASDVIVNSQMELRDALQVIADEARRALDGVSALTLYLYDPSGDQISLPPVSSGVKHTDVWDRPVRSDSPVRRVIEQGELEFVENASDANTMMGGFSAREGVKAYAGAPLNANSETVGVMFLNYDQAHRFSDEERTAIRIFSRQAGSVIQMARLYSDANRRLQESQILQEVCISLTTTLEPKAVLQHLVHAAMQLTGADEASILLYDRNDQTFNDALTASGEDSPLKVSETPNDPEDLPYQILHSRMPVVVPDTLRDSRFSPVELNTGWGAIIGMPIYSAYGPIGVLYANWKSPQTFSLRQTHMLHALASESAVAIENARLYEEARRRAEQLESLRSTSLVITSTLERKALVNRILQEAVNLLRSKSAGFYEYYSEQGVLRVIADYRRPYNVGKTLNVGEGMAGQLVQSHDPYMIIDDYKGWGERATIYDDQEPFGSVLEVPLKWHDEVVGILYIERDAGSAYTEEDITLLRFFAEQASVALVNSRMLREQEQLLKDFTEQKNHLASIVDNCPIGIVVNDSEGNVIECNRAAEAMLEYSEDEMKRQSVTSLYYDREEAHRIGKLLSRSDNGILAHHKTIVRSKHGGRFPVRLSASWLYDVNHQRTGALGCFEDLREIEAAENRMGHLLRIIGDVAKEETLGKGLANLAESVVVLLSATFCRILLLDEGDSELVVKAAHPIARSNGAMVWEPELEARIPLSAWPGLSDLLKDGKASVLRSSDAESRRLLQDLTRVLKMTSEIHSLLLVPLKIGNRTVGLLDLGEVRDERRSRFTADKIRFATAIAAQTAVLIDRLRMYELTKRRGELLEALDKASRHMRAEKETSKLMQEVVRLSASLVDCENGGLYTIKAFGGALELEGSVGVGSDALPKRFDDFDHLISRVARSGIAQATHQDTRISGAAPSAHKQRGQSIAAVPLKKDGAVEGVLFVCDPEGERQFTNFDLDILERFAVQASMALQTSHLLGQEQRAFVRLSTLHRISDYILASDDLDRILHILLTGITASYGLSFNRALLMLLDEKKENLIGEMGIGHADDRLARRDWEQLVSNGSDTLAHYLDLADKGSMPTTPMSALIQSVSLVVDAENMNQITRAIHNRQPELVKLGELDELPPEILNTLEPISPVIIAPLVIQNEVIGVVIADNKFTRAPITDEDAALLKTYANTAAIAIQNARLLRTAESDRRQIQLCYALSNSLISSEAPEKVLKDTVDRMTEAAQASWAMMILVDDRKNIREIITNGDIRDPEPGLIRSNGFSMTVIQSREVVCIDNMEKERDRVNPALFQKKVGAAVCLPVLLRGKCLGVMWIHYERPRHFAGHEVTAFQLFVNQAAIAYDSARQLKELESMHDAAKGLSGATSLSQVLSQIVVGAKRVLNADAVLVWCYDDVQDRFLQYWEPEGLPAAVCDELRTLIPKAHGTASRILDNELLHVANIEDLQQAEAIGPTTIRLLKLTGTTSFVGIGLRIHEEKLGILYLMYNAMRDFDERDKKTALTFTEHATLALKKAKLLDQMHDARDTATLVAKLTTLERLDEALLKVAEGTCKALRCDIVCLFVYDEKEGVFESPAIAVAEYLQAGASDVRLTPSAEADSLLRKILALDQFYPCEETLVDQLSSHIPLLREHDIKSCAAIPLTTGSKKTGFMFVSHRSPHTFRADEISSIELFAYQAAVAIGNAQLFERVNRRASALEALRQASISLTSSLELEDILSRMAEQAWMIASQRGRKNAHASIILMEAGKPQLIASFPDYPPNPFPASARRGVTGRAWQLSESQRVADTRKDSDYILLHPDTRSELAVIIRSKDRHIGVIDVECEELGAFDHEDQETLESLAAQAAIAIENARRFEDMKQVKGYVGSLTAVDWMKLVSKHWLHDLNTGIGRALSKLGIVQLKLAGSPSQIGAVESVLDELEILIKEISNIPVLAPLADEGSTVKINALLDSYLKSRWKQGIHSHISVLSDLQDNLDELASVRVSHAWLLRVLEIVTDNAANALQESRIANPRLRVITRLCEIPENRRVIEISLVDNGPGIPDPILEKLFRSPIEKTTGDSRSGFGLLLAKTIVESYKGQIFVRSTGLEGTTLVVSLPAQPEEPDGPDKLSTRVH